MYIRRKVIFCIFPAGNLWLGHPVTLHYEWVLPLDGMDRPHTQKPFLRQRRSISQDWVEDG